GIALVLAAQSLRYRDLSLPHPASRAGAGAESGASLKAAVRETARGAAAVASARERHSRDRTAAGIAPIEASQRQLRCRDPTARNSAGPRIAGRSHSPANSRISAA